MLLCNFPLSYIFKYLKIFYDRKRKHLLYCIGKKFRTNSGMSAAIQARVHLTG